MKQGRIIPFDTNAAGPDYSISDLCSRAGLFHLVLMQQGQIIPFGTYAAGPFVAIKIRHTLIGTPIKFSPLLALNEDYQSADTGYHPLAHQSNSL